MRLDERDEGDYRIYAGALEGKQGDGYVAAVVVSKVRGVETPIAGKQLKRHCGTPSAKAANSC
jgi:hypothetical protein